VDETLENLFNPQKSSKSLLQELKNLKQFAAISANLWTLKNATNTLVSCKLKLKLPEDQLPTNLTITV
jgi:hypothetical protein